MVLSGVAHAHQNGTIAWRRRTSTKLRVDRRRRRALYVYLVPSPPVQQHREQVKTAHALCLQQVFVSERPQQTKASGRHCTLPPSLYQPGPNHNLTFTPTGSYTGCSEAGGHQIEEGLSRRLEVEHNRYRRTQAQHVSHKAGVKEGLFFSAPSSPDGFPVKEAR